MEDMYGHLSSLSYESLHNVYILSFGVDCHSELQIICQQILKNEGREQFDNVTLRVFLFGRRKERYN